MRKLVVIATLALAVSGCTTAEVPSAGSTTSTTPPSSTTTEPTSTTPATTPETTTASPTKPGLSPVPSGAIPQPPGADEVTLEGVVQSGVEAGCRLLLSQGAQYLLLGGDPNVLTEGRRVVVRGKVQAGVATTCQQGVPFIVADVKVAG